MFNKLFSNVILSVLGSELNHEADYQRFVDHILNTPKVNIQNEKYQPETCLLLHYDIMAGKITDNVVINKNILLLLQVCE